MFDFMNSNDDLSKSFSISTLGMLFILIYKAKIIDPIITNIPSPAPTSVGHEVPEFGSDGVDVVVATGVEVELPHPQLVLLVHDGFLQKP